MDENAAQDLLNGLDAPKKRMLEALEMANGVVTAACNACDIPRCTFYWWCKNDPIFKTAVDDIQEIAIDFVESKLFERINSKDTIATIFFLKTRGKKRGYVEKHEIDAPDGIFVMMKKAGEPQPDPVEHKTDQ